MSALGAGTGLAAFSTGLYQQSRATRPFREVLFGRIFHGDGDILQFGTVTHLWLLSTLPVAGVTEQQNTPFTLMNSYQWLSN